MKPAILGVVGLLVGLGGGTGVTMMKNKKLQAEVAAKIAEHAPAEGKKPAHVEGGGADSAKAEGEPKDSAAAPGEAAAPAGEHAANPAIPSAALAPAKPVEPTHEGKAPELAAKTPEAAPAETPSKVVGKGEVRPAHAPATKPDSAQRAAGFKQLGRIFGSMKAADAVKVMALMTDDEVEGVLRSLGPKQAADMLGLFPKDRAASLSRRLLVPTGKG